MTKNPQAKPFDKPVVILHGWSDKSVSFEPIATFLREHEAEVVSIWLGDYQSMRDRITLWDLGLAFRRALEGEKIPLDRFSFDCVIHSTGALVAREFLRQICGDNSSLTPIRNLVMLAPADFGSPLAKIGKSVMGRLFKGWNFDDVAGGSIGETGERVLDALEMASPYSWDLGLKELLGERASLFSSKNCRCTILVGTNKYSGMRGVTHVAGGDGTVLVSTANLNAHYYRVDFVDPDDPEIVETKSTRTPIAFAVLDRNHGTITHPDDRQENVPQVAEWQQLFLGGLQITEAGYAGHVQACERQTAQTFAQGKGDNFHQYMHVVFQVRDQFGQPVSDYVIDFYQLEDDAADRVYQKIHRDVLEKVWTNTRNASFRSFLLDLTDLRTYLDEHPKARVELSVGAARISREIGFRNPTQPARGVRVFDSKKGDFWHVNQTVLVEMILHRIPTDEVFTLRHPRET